MPVSGLLHAKADVLSRRDEQGEASRTNLTKAVMNLKPVKRKKGRCMGSFAPVLPFYSFASLSNVSCDVISADLCGLSSPHHI
jgi:hypothetical protein